jgi:Spx/MgsR family transcriptional regulator
MIKIYGIKNCSSMKKAFDLLSQLNIPYEFHDYKKLGIDDQHIQDWADQVGLYTLLNKKGTTWRKFTAEEQTHILATEAQSIQAMIDNPSLIKRPVLVAKNRILVGFDPLEYQSLLS